MFSSLSNALEGLGVTLEKDSFILISETPFVSANSLVVYHLLKCVPERNVCFLATQNTWSHYCNIANKMGVNLRTKMEEGSVKVVEVLKTLTQLLTTSENHNNPFNFIVDDSEQSSLKKLYLTVRKTIEGFQNKPQQIALIIDSVTPLLLLGIKVNEIELFVRYCSDLLCFPRDVFVISCSVDDNDSASKQLVTQLLHHSSTVLSVRGLETGKSLNVHGELDLYTCPEHYYYKGLRTHHKFHFKVEERDVRIFSPGLASHVL